MSADNAFPGPLASPAWLAENVGHVLVLDIRSADAFAAGHIPGAVHSDYAADGWRVAATPGHASHHVAYLREDEGWAFVGDVAGVRIMPG